jgi:hypothetical protein
MKYYKLKKDIPMFKAGDLFYINSDQGCLVQKDTIRLAFHKETLEEYPEILRDWFEEVEEPGYKRWRAEEDDEYYTINRIGCVCRSRDTRQPEDDYRYKTGSYGRTAEELEAKLKYDIARQVLLDDAKGFKPDWEDVRQTKYYGCYGHEYKYLRVSYDYRCQDQGAIYFKTRKDLEESFEKHRKEWLIVLGIN